MALDSEESRPITGEFEDAVERLYKVASELYSATFETLPAHHGAIVEAVALLTPYLGGLYERIQEWYVDEEGDFPELAEPYGAALSNALNEFDGLRNNIDRPIAYAHSYNEFSNEMGNLVSFCKRWNWEHGIFEAR